MRTLFNLAISLFAYQNNTTMKRIDLVKIGGFVAEDHLVTTEVPFPTPKENEILIDVKASAVNPVDWKMAEYGFFLPKNLPAALGCDVAGVVLAPESMKGKRVVSYLDADKTSTKTTRGAFVDQVIADVVTEIPEEMSFVQAATLPVGGLTAMLLLDALTIQSGDWVLVWGASSSVGFHTVQLAKQRDFKVIAIASEKFEVLMKTMGADGFVDYRKGTVAEDVPAILDKDTLYGAVDCIGNADSFGTCAKLVQKNRGIVSTVSGMTPDVEGVTKVPVSLGTVITTRRSWVESNLPALMKLETQQVHLVKGTVTAKTVQQAFQISKDGLSGEKLIIEWMK